MADLFFRPGAKPKSGAGLDVSFRGPGLDPAGGRWKATIFGALWLLTVLVLTACSRAPETGPGKVRWDRDTCVRCGMAISDPMYSAQIRVHPHGGGKSKLYKFDDIGCAVIWLDQQPFKDDPSVEIWVNDYQTGKWIDARKAWYVPGRVTPMGYGLGATTRKEPGAMDFAAARKHIYQVEQSYHLHRGAASDHSHPETSSQ